MHLRFLRRPVAFEEGASGRVGAVVFEKCVLEGDVNAQTAVGTGELERIECDLAVCAVGYTASPPCPDGGRAIPQAGPAGTYAQVGSRVAPGLYCAGWVKRGPTGIVGSTSPAANGRGRARDPAAGGGGRRGRPSWADWRRIDSGETTKTGHEVRRRQAGVCACPLGGAAPHQIRFPGATVRS